MHGYGRYAYANGAVYEGDFDTGSMQGDGVIVYADGARYEGAWLADEAHGQGIRTLANGAQYRGMFAMGKVGGAREGGSTRGQRCSLDSCTPLPPHRRQMHGRGTSYQSNGDRFSGAWEDGQRAGDGSLRYANGDVLRCPWAVGTLQGSGTLRCANGDVYDGGFLVDAAHGFGTLTSGSPSPPPSSSSGSSSSSSSSSSRSGGAGKERYEGEWQRGQRHGRGSVFFAGGHRVTGEWAGGVLVQVRQAEGGRRAGGHQVGVVQLCFPLLLPPLQGGGGGGGFTDFIFADGSPWDPDSDSYRAATAAASATEGGSAAASYDIDGLHYEGACEGGQRHGRGTVILPGGHSFTAEWCCGRTIGAVTFSFAEGSRWAKPDPVPRVAPTGVQVAAAPSQ